jgi:hypothetical protein
MAISTIRPGRAYYPSQQSASVSSDTDPHEWTQVIAPKGVILVGGGGLGGAYVGSTAKVPSGYTARNVVVHNFSSLVEDFYLKFSKTIEGALVGSEHALISARGPLYSQGDFDQFVIYNPTTENITVSIQWDASGVPVSTNGGHPGHGSAALDLSGFLGSVGTYEVSLPWGRARRLTGITFYTSTGFNAPAGEVDLEVNGTALFGGQVLGSLTPESPLTVSLTPTDIVKADDVKVILSNLSSQPAGRDLFVEITYEFI